MHVMQNSVWGKICHRLQTFYQVSIDMSMPACTAVIGAAQSISITYSALHGWS